MKVLNTLVVGIGKQAREDHIPALMSSSDYNIIGLIEIDVSQHKSLLSSYEVPVYSSIEEALSKSIPDVAVLTLPHSEYKKCIKILAKNNVHIIKEKPFALNLAETKEYHTLMRKHNITIQVTLQRRFNPIFSSVPQLIRSIGKVFAIEAKYTFNIDKLDEGWRARSIQSGGGALIDMGYHVVDLLVWYFGLPDQVAVSTSAGNREGQLYDVEDTAYMSLRYGDGEHTILGNVVISRVFPKKQEHLKIYGTKGSIHIERGRVEHFDNNGNLVESLSREGAWPSALVSQYEMFAGNIRECQLSRKESYLIHEHIKHAAFIDASYLSAQTNSIVNARQMYEAVLIDLQKEENL